MTGNSIHIASLKPGSADRNTLEQLVEKYPYFTSAWVKLLLELKAAGDEHGVATLLPKVAAMVPDRAVLKKHLEAVSMQALEKTLETRKEKSPEREDTQQAKEELHIVDEKEQIAEEKSLEEPAQKIAVEQIESPQKEEIGEIKEEESSKAREKEEIDIKKEAHSFTEWLHLLQGEKESDSGIDAEEKQDEEVKEPVEEELIDRSAATAAEYQLEAARFDEEERNGQIDLEEESELSEGDLQSARDLAAKSLAMDESLITETLATVYQIQGKKEKAIQIYERLILKIPEKSAYFAAQIKKLKGE